MAHIQTSRKAIIHTMADSTPTKEQYEALMADIILLMSTVLGMQLALSQSRKIKELHIHDDGTVVIEAGTPMEALRKLIDTYVELSGPIVLRVIMPLFEKYPNIQVVYGK